MDSNRTKEDKYRSPSTSSAGAQQDQLFPDSEMRRKQLAEKIGVSNVFILGMEINGVAYQGVLLPRKECKNKKT